MRLMLYMALLLSAQSAVAAPSLLGLCHRSFSCSGVRALYNGQDKLTLSWLENTFGTECKCAEELLSDSRPKTIRVHLINSPCFRNKRCGSYEVLYGVTLPQANRSFITKRGQPFLRFKRVLKRAASRIARAKAPVTCYVSPCLECDLNERARRVMGDLVSAAMPSCNLVDNPYRQRCIPGYTCEKHGETARVSKPCIVDLDGTDGQTIDVKKWLERYKDCDLRFYWEPWMNCISGAFIDPRKRSCVTNTKLFKRVKEDLCQYFYPLFGTC